MNLQTLGFALLTTAGATILAVPAHAQKMTEMGTGDGGSVHVKSEWTVAPAHLSITYGRPKLKGRAEGRMMPADSVWRTGADVATILTTDKTLRFGTITLAPGSYTINTQPGATSWSFIAGKLSEPMQWGTPYQPNLELGRAPMKLGKTQSPVELLTISIIPAKSGGTLRVEWGTTSASIPFTVLP